MTRLRTFPSVMAIRFDPNVPLHQMSFLASALGCEWCDKVHIYALPEHYRLAMEALALPEAGLGGWLENAAIILIVEQEGLPCSTP